MAGSPRVQLSLKGRLLSEVPFVAPQLRIGRMRENDVVVNNLAVSRFHATLRREGDDFVLEDLGSENGTQLNGERIRGAVPMTASDVIQLGKYELRIVLQPGLAIAGPPKAKANDAWDSSQTFLSLDGKPPTPKAAAAPKRAPVVAPKAAAAPVPSELEDVGVPDPEGVFAFGEEDLAAIADESAASAKEIQTDPMTTPALEQTSLFDFGDPAAPSRAAEKEAPAFAVAPNMELASDDAPEAPRENLHAGLIVQRDGKLHQLRSWETGDLTAGRAAECDLVLADAGVSRRHALFSHSTQGYAVRDLGSVNGIYVNGQRTKQHALSVGDVVRIESFELTFVLDHQPIGSEVSAPAPSTGKGTEPGRATEFSLQTPAAYADEPLDLAPLAGNPTEAPGLGGEEVTAESAADGLDAAVGDDEEPFDLAPLAGDPNEAPGLRESGPSSLASEDLGVLSTAEDPFRAALAPELPGGEASLPEADLITDEAHDDEEKDAAFEGIASSESPGLAARQRPLRAIALRVSVDPRALSERARAALATLEEEGVSLSAQLSFEAQRDG